MDGLIFNDEAAIANVPVPFLTINSVAPTIMAFGTEEQKKFFLPKIAAGELHFAIGYSEPGAGTDLAALRTTAVRDGDDYVINGQKMWTSLIAYADYVWLAVRTNPEAKKHRGISMLIVPTTAEGFSWTPVHTMAGVDTSATYYQDVRVPTTSLVGEENGGWKLVTNQLNHERVALVSAQPIFVALNGVREWAQNTKDIHGNRLIDSEWVQLNLARVHAKAEVLKLINWELASTEEPPVTRRRIGGQGVRHRAGHRGLPPADGGAGHGGHASDELPWRAAAWTRRADAPQLPDPDLRRRHQRDSARHHRHGRARPAQGQSVRKAEISHGLFKTTEAADDLGGLARTITESVCTAEHQRELDGLEQRFDRDLWGKLIDADILSTAAPESLGGGGFGVLEQVAVLVALGRQLAAVPYLESVVLGAGALAKFGSESLQQEWAAPAINGEKIIAVALDGEMGEGPVQAQLASGSGYRLTGSRTQVGYGPVADAFLVPAETDSGTKVFLVAKDDAGVTMSALDTTGHGSVAHLELQGVEAARLVGGDDVRRLAHHTWHLGRSAYQLGVLERALELTSEYAREREQFDRPIGSFQAVSSRLADGYIDVKGLRLTLTQAAWRLSEDLPADVEVHTAAFWAADAGHRVAHTTVHVHGGVGIDLDHPVHRYFLAAKQTEFAVGSATGQLLRIGRELADTPA